MRGTMEEGKGGAGKKLREPKRNGGEMKGKVKARGENGTMEEEDGYMRSKVETGRERGVARKGGSRGKETTSIEGT
jgi:hypothetical protein